MGNCTRLGTALPLLCNIEHLQFYVYDKQTSKNPIFLWLWCVACMACASRDESQINQYFSFECTEKATPSQCVPVYLISTKITYSNEKANITCGEERSASGLETKIWIY